MLIPYSPLSAARQVGIFERALLSKLP